MGENIHQIYRSLVNFLLEFLQTQAKCHDRVLTGKYPARWP
jgi:hypothetical protein